MVMGGPGFEAMSCLNIYDLALAVLAAVVLCSFKVSGRGCGTRGKVVTIDESMLVHS